MSLNGLGTTWPYLPLLTVSGSALIISQAGDAIVDLSGTGGGGGDPATWSQYPATQAVQLGTQNLNDVGVLQCVASYSQDLFIGSPLTASTNVGTALQDLFNDVGDTQARLVQVQSGVWNYDPSGGPGTWYQYSSGALSFSTVLGPLEGGAQAWLDSVSAIVNSGVPVYVIAQQDTAFQRFTVNVQDSDPGVIYLLFTASTPTPLWTVGQPTQFSAYTAIPNPLPAPYGNFYSTQTQTMAASPGTALTFNTTAEASGIDVSGSEITVATAGTYSFTFSAQIVGGNNEEVHLYFVLNGTPIPDSASYIDVKSAETAMLTVNFIQTLAANDVLQVFGVSPNGTSTITYAATTPVASPSIIFTIQSVIGQGPQGAQGPPGPAGGLTNPLTSDILANGYSIQNAATIQANTIQVSTDPSINIASPVSFTDPTVPAQFTLPPQTAVAPTVANDLANKAYVDGTAVSLPGLFNYLRITPTASGQNQSVVKYDVGAGGVGYPSTWVPDASTNITILPTLGADNSWRLTKPAGAGGTGQRWWVWPYNNYPNSIPLSSAPNPPATPILKKNLNALYAIIRVRNANIATQGSFFFNVYQYDFDNPPAGAFSVRHDYQANTAALPDSTATMTFQNGFTYVVFAQDAEKTVANPAAPGTIAVANGQTATQLTSEMLRDPYDIHTTLNHVPLTAVAYAVGSPAPADINASPISAIVFGTTSSSLTTGCDIEVLKIGFKANGGAINEEYSLQYA
jgi:hypothetical protein